jgi:hypothetical protein
MTDSDMVMTAVYFVVLIGSVLLLSAISMRGTKPRHQDVSAAGK